MAQTTESVVKSTRYIKIYDIWYTLCVSVCVCASVRHINTSHRQIVFPIFAQRRSWQMRVAAACTAVAVAVGAGVGTGSESELLKSIAAS